MSLTQLAAFGMRDVRWYGAKGDGSTDDTAAFQAAYDALPDSVARTGMPDLPGGGTIIVPPGRYPVHQLTLSRRKPVAFVGLGGRPQRKFNATDKTAKGVATLIGLDTGDDSRIFSITDGGNVTGYGFEFSGLNFDLTAGTQYAIFAVNVNNTIVQNCGAASIDSPPRMQWLIRAYGEDLGPGQIGDSSWWRIADNYATRCGLAYIGMTGVYYHNHNTLAHNICHTPGNQVDACIKMIYSTRSMTFANNLEMVDNTQAVGLYLEHTWGGVHLMDTGESVAGSTFYKLRSTTGNLIVPGGLTAPTGSTLIDEKYSHNLFLSPRGGLGDGGDTTDYTKDAFAGSRLFGMSGDGLVGTMLAHVPASLRVGQLSLVEDMTDIVPLGTISAQHLVSGSHVSWSPANLQDVRYPNADGPTITSTDTWPRFTVGPVSAGDWPLLVVTLESSFALPNGATINVYTKDAGTGTTTATQTWTIDDGMTMRGFSLQLPKMTASSNIMVEMRISNHPVGGTIKVTRIQLLSTLQGSTKTGAVMRGPGTPEGAVTAPVGTMFLRTDGGAGTTMYVKESGTGSSGWRAV